MPSTDRKLELKAKTSVAQTASQAAVYAKGLIVLEILCVRRFPEDDNAVPKHVEVILIMNCAL
jgi:hypothetical protein